MFFAVCLPPHSDVERYHEGEVTFCRVAGECCSFSNIPIRRYIGGGVLTRYVRTDLYPMKTLLDTLDTDRVREAVAEAETQTAGEIVPVVVTQSDDYDVSVWRGASVLAVLALGLVLLFVQFYEGWGFGWVYTSWGVVLIALIAGTVGAGLVAAIPALKRWLAGPDRLDRMVHHRAMRAFVENEVFNTRDRTGILLFVSLLEHRIEVLGDAGINEKVDPEDWVEIVRRIRRGIKNDNLTEGMVDAIGMCGDLLERSGVEIRPDDEDELSNRVRTPNQDD